MDTEHRPSITKQTLIPRFQQIRQTTLEICSYIENEDFVVQPRAEVSPPKWHLGHTTWFFETIIVKKFKNNYTSFNDQYNELFNSYYKAAGSHTIQSERGNLSRPTVAEVMRYRTYVNDALISLLSEIELTNEIASLIETGIHHEQQHQELLYMDIKAILASNVLSTKYASAPLNDAVVPVDGWTSFDENLYEIGDDGVGFSYDNERPQHKHYLYPFSISQSLVTNGDFLAFMQDNGYAQAQYWLSQGWDWVGQQNIQHPLYWVMVNDQWHEYTLHGLIPLDLNRPLVHISYFEADAFANWKGLRLPTEQELEVFLAATKVSENNTSTQTYHPNSALANTGQVWCWTRSQYTPYPRFKAFDGILNEYNGKFMCNQFVLKGGCIVTPNNHYRHSYRNFYLPEQRWMFSGIRLAKDII
jgi:ergothioneine biosynthesis protein EgtB